MLLLLFLGVCFATYFYTDDYYTNVYRTRLLDRGNSNETFVTIPTGSNFSTVVGVLKEKGLIEDTVAFRFLAEEMDYSERVFPGRYRISKGMSEEKLLNLLRTGMQEPLRVPVGRARNFQELAQMLDETLELDSASFINLLKDTTFLALHGLSTENLWLLFQGDDVEMYWNTDAQEAFRKFYEQYEAFWNEERLALADTLGMTPMEVYTLASIVQAETYRSDEYPRIAGVYLNRLNRGMKLQADPTVRFAVNDRRVKRIYYEHTRIDHPYNTYVHHGLPPGPLSFVKKSAIDAVLNSEKHRYLYFCARKDFSGYHNFAITYEQHKENAKQYASALDANGIY